MLRLSFTLLALALPVSVAAEHNFADSIRVEVTFNGTYNGTYRPGEPYDYLTVTPDGTGETLADTGILVEVFAVSPQGDPYVGIPASEIVLFSPDLDFCFPLNPADGPTDENGYTTFTGTIGAGGCVQSLDVYIDGIFIAQIPININSPDFSGVSALHVDASDLAQFAQRLGDEDGWDICFDFNESGPPTIDASDLAFFALHLGKACVQSSRLVRPLVPAPRRRPKR